MSLIAWLWKITVLDPGISRSSLGFVASWGLVTLQEFSIQHNLHRKCLFSVWKLRQVETKVSKECRIFECILCLLAQVKPLLLLLVFVLCVHFTIWKSDQISAKIQKSNLKFKFKGFHLKTQSYQKSTWFWFCSYFFHFVYLCTPIQITT